MRLYQIIKLNGYTKKEMKDLYDNGKITVNNNIIPLSYEIIDTDIIKIHDKEINIPKFRYYLYNKPIGIECMIKNRKDSYINNIDSDIKLMVAGRLDKNSCGLVILSNDGSFIHKIQNNKDIKKVYMVKFEKEITNEFISSFDKDYIIRGKKTSKILVEYIDKYTLLLTLSEGRYHEIRNIAKYNNNKVIYLKRIQIGKYKIDNIDEGKIKEIDF